MNVLARLAGVAAAATMALGASIPAHAAQGLEGIPAYDHVGVLVLENQSFTSTWGSGSVATYLNSLVPGGAFADMYFGTGHVSLDNYIAMTSGQGWTPATGSDCATQNLFQCAAVNSVPAGGVNIADQIETAGKSWAGYMDGTTTACFHGDASMTAPAPDPYQGNGALGTNYADRHNPFIYYNNILTNATRCTQHVLPYSRLATDISGNALPSFFFITPDTCHDGHDTPCAMGSSVPPCAPRNAAAGGLTSADCWLQANLAPLVTYLNAHNGVLFITFDEAANTDTTGCCTGGLGGTPGFGGRVGLLALGPGVAAGSTTHHSYDHASMLRTFEDALGINTYLGNAGSATAMSELFATPGTSAPETPLVVALPLVAIGALLVWRIRKRRT